MREIKVERDREWIVVTTTRRRTGKPPLVKRTYWSPDELALIISLTREMISPSTSVP